MARVDIYNREVSNWARDTRLKLKKEFIQLTAVYSGQGKEGVNVKTAKYAGEASKISFAFPYYLVFVHKGAGRGYGGSISKQFTNSSGGKSKTSATSSGKMGTGKRVAKPWFNPIVENQFPDLANIIVDYHGDKVIARIQKILIR